MLSRLPSALILALGFGTAAAGQDFADGRLTLGAGVSTLGFTVEPSMRLNERWGVRAPFGAGSISFDDESNGQDYSGDLDLGGLGIMGDYYPMTSSGFRVSAGIFYTDYSADLSSDDVTIDGITSEVTARVRQRRDIMPALAVGYDGNITQNTVLSVTLGGIFGDGFDVSASESSGLVPQALVDAEVDDIRDDLKDYDVIPFVQLSLALRF